MGAADHGPGSRKGGLEVPVGGVRVVRRILQRWEWSTSRAFPVGVCPGLLGPEGKENALCVSDELWSHTCHTGWEVEKRFRSKCGVLSVADDRISGLN